MEYSDLVVCFTYSTEILTKRGKQPIENLRVGDMIVTRNNGLQPLNWIGSKTVPAEGKASPICISAGTLGNLSDLLISPNHRMLISAASSDLLFGQQKVLINAKRLLRTPRHL
ncbi:MAG: hypothetical protein HOH68_09930 [Rhodobacteraceae bacterium]|nr:hypothetical protein [Paracoccaceae bacterium]